MFGNNNNGGGLFGRQNNGGGGGLFGGSQNQGGGNSGGGLFGGGINSNAGKPNSPVFQSAGQTFGSNNQGTSMPNQQQQQQQDQMNDINVSSPDMLPVDSVQSLKWMKNEGSLVFATADWAGDVRIYQVVQNGGSANLNNVKTVNLGGPIFEIEWTEDGSAIIAALGSGKVKAIQIASGQIADVAEHPGLTSMKLITIQNDMFILTIGQDQNLVFWKLGTPQPMMNVKLQYIPMVMDFCMPYLVIGCSDSQIAVIQMEKFMQNQKIAYSKCNLESPIMSISLKPNSTRLAAGSIDGRICMTDMSFDYNGNVKFTDYILFRAHRHEVKNQPQQSYLYQVNCIGFHKKYPNYLYSCGANSITYFWDCINKNKSAEFNYAGTSTTAADHSPCGQLFAYALGYDWSQGVWDLPNVKQRPFVCVHVVKNGEIRI